MLSPAVQKILRYLVSGTIAAAINLSILFLLVHFLHVHYLIASVASFSTALIGSFLMQKFWTFQNSATKGVHFQLARYILVTVTINLGINTGLMYLFVSVLGVWYLLAQVFAGIILAVFSYFVYQHFVFTLASSPQ